MTPEVMWSMNRLGEYAVSPDGKHVVYNNTYFIIEENKSKTDIYIIDIDGNNNKCLTSSASSEYSPVWNKDGSKILFMTADSGEMQVWEMNPDGTERKQVSFVEGGVSGFKYSPDENQLLFTAEVKLKDNVADVYPDLPLSSGRINNDLMYRHWDQWVDTYAHIFVTADNGKNKMDIMEGEMWEAPVRPWGGMEQIAWTKDGQNILYSCRKKVGKEYATSTNTDIYKYNIPTGECVNLTEGMMGYDMNVVVSPQGD
jgi:Tol biopolymer transport system component